MTPAERGLSAIKEFEGLRLQAYPDPATGGEPWTIGFGHTGGVKPGDTITPQQAEDMLAEDLAACDEAIDSCVNVPLTDGQTWALRSFILNLGAGAFKDSTLLKFLNAGDYTAAADQFGRWIFANRKPMPGLISRRAAERSMFLDGIEGHAPAPAPAPARPLPPVETHEPVPVEVFREKPMVPLIPIFAALLPTLIDAIPKLKALFPGSEVSERNVKVAETAFKIAQDALGATNAQQVVEMVQADPVAAQTASKAVEEAWFTLTQIGGGIESARKADVAFVAAGAKPHQSPAFIISVILLLMPFMLLVDAFFVHSASYPSELRTQIVTGVLMVVGIVGGYWLGSSFGSARKTELDAAKA